MRHVTPFSFIKLLLETQLKNTDSSETLFESFSENLKRFTLNDKGICLTQKEYNSLELKEDAYKFKMNTIKSTEQRTYYLIKQDKFQDKWFKKLKFTKEQKDRTEKNYTIKKTKFMVSALKYLQEAIDDQNTFNIACEALARLTLILFNSKTDIAFPEEGNSIIYEIRFYEHEEDGKAGNKNYRVLSHKEMIDKIEKKEKLKNKIRIVDNEGFRIENAKDALELISNCIRKYIVNPKNSQKRAKDFEDYQKCDTKLILPEPTKEELKLNETYDAELKEENFLSISKYHIAKHLYTVFDFKPLEPKVVVPALSSDVVQQRIKVLTSAKGTYQTKYCVKDGATYRRDQKRSFVGYNSKVKFRQEVSDKTKSQEKEFIAKKAIEHLNISLSAFTLFTEPFEKNERMPFEIFKSFMQLVEIDHGIEYDNLEQTIKLEEFWSESQGTDLTVSGSEFEVGTSR